jgi:nitrite reductase/ring-hydroxylating ferredoxin subunit
MQPLARLLIVTTTIVWLTTLSSCKRCNQTGVPYVPVNYQLVVSNPEFSPLLAVGGWIYIGGGSRGIIVYRAAPDEFKAYDRHCTWMVEENCRVTVDNTDITAVDSECCDSKFLIVDGAPIAGPAAIGLQQYQTDFDGNTLYIFN